MSAENVLFDAPGPRARRRHAILTAFGVVLLLATLALVLWKLNAQGQLTAALWSPLVDPEVWTSYVVPGLINTLKAAAVSIVAAMVFGVLFGMGRLSQNAAIRWFSGIIVEFFRAVPVLLMMYFLFQLFAFNNIFVASLNSFMAVVIALTLYNGSVIAELVRSGVYSLPKGQSEAGLSIGLTAPQTMRSIQLPQALTAMLPALVSQVVVILKDSALGAAITYPELLQSMRDMGTAYATVIPAYVLAAAIFIALNFGLTTLAGRVESRLNRRGRGPRRGALATGVTGAGTVDTPTDGIAGAGVHTGDATNR
ncbi:amino acid ABC transporter permease [Terracoccus sp. 273MFTsu3.1]|uniref:amino acid ABC transporter permease n=1 Tax=Terracoccus sp. 273MFTsu3.1 TaxID=1172188 RepID=UPI00036F3B8E|nr:amino acid ABC transporter permease [Terracoccus sp. 273MFTsu3.1]